MRRLCWLMICLIGTNGMVRADFSFEDIFLDISSSMEDADEASLNELHEILLDLHEQPIELNSATYRDLRRIPFLTETQIANLITHIRIHPLDDMRELMLISGFKDYDIRNLSFFVYIDPNKKGKTALRPYANEVFRYGRHELDFRVDARHLESFQGDPVFAQFRYKFNYRHRVQYGLNLRRPAGGGAKDLQYGGYIRLNNMGPFQTIVAGNFQASFGLGLVSANAYRMGKSAYVTNVPYQNEGLSHYSGVDGSGMHGLGATAEIPVRLPDAHLRLSAWYSLTRPNDSTRQHAVGANLDFRWRQLKVGLTAVENIYSDSLRYYFESAAYNQNYFRGNRQMVLGLNFRYNWGKVDWFGEVATAQNRKWGYAATTGLRLVPVEDVNLMLLYRYYSPTFDNLWGYAFSETSRINDENGIYLAMDIRSLSHWRFSAYGDVFRFSGIKYGIPFAPSWGYDAMGRVEWNPNAVWQMNLQLRAREKGKKANYSARYQFRYLLNQFTFTTRADANLVPQKGGDGAGNGTLGYGAAVMQDVAYSFVQAPVRLNARVAAFDAMWWDNRIYTYENDVLYGNSIPALSGRGLRAYFNLRWQIFHRDLYQLVLYFRMSETYYFQRHYSSSSSSSASSSLQPPTQTDLHLLLRLIL